MKPQMATIVHDPARGFWGDCHRAALASILDLPAADVPHFQETYGTDPTSAWAAERDWLARQDLTRINIAYPGTLSLSEILVAVAMLNPGIYHLVGGVGRSGEGRTLVCVNGRVAHDPSLDASGIVGPTADGMFWVSFIGKNLASEELRDVLQRQDPAGFARGLVERAAL